jgi:LysR family transcriptional regulator for bpeEF and oprC
LIAVLEDIRQPAVPVSLLYPHHAFLSPAMRAFADRTTEFFSNVVMK